MSTRPLSHDLTHVPVRAKLPADLWRCIARVESTADRGIAVVRVQEAGDDVFVMSERHYQRLLNYINALEQYTYPNGRYNYEPLEEDDAA